ncbi:MAG: hypothetical protein ACREH4_01355 [Vitreimonas sp.]
MTAFYLIAYAIGIAITASYLVLVYRDAKRAGDPAFAPRNDMERHHWHSIVLVSMSIFALAWPIYWALSLLIALWWFCEERA